jgi:glutamate synthase domain-containing protein 2
MLEKIAVGASAVNTARSMMLALGCIQARSCNTNLCPTGIATQDPARERAVDVDEKAQRVRNYHERTIHSFLELCGAMGLEDPDDLAPEDLLRRSESIMRSFVQSDAALEPGQLLSADIPASFRTDWDRAQTEKF